MPSESVSSATGSYNDAEEVDALLTVLSPTHSKIHTPEGHFQSLEGQMTSMDIGEMQHPSRKGKEPEQQAFGASFLEHALGDPGQAESEGPGPGPGPGVTTAAPHSNPKRNISRSQRT